MKNVSREKLFRRGVEEIIRPYLFELNLSQNRAAICHSLTLFVNEFFNTDIIVVDRTSPDEIDENLIKAIIIDTLSNKEYTINEYINLLEKNTREY